MQCPVCNSVQLVMTTRQDIEIDYCPTCRGVWLDRGELDKIIERSQRDTDRTQTVSGPSERSRPLSDEHRSGRHGGGHHAGGRGHGGFLRRLFD